MNEPEISEKNMNIFALIVILKNTNALVKPLNELKHFHGAESVILQGAVLLNAITHNVVAAAKPLSE